MTTLRHNVLSRLLFTTVLAGLWGLFPQTASAQILATLTDRCSQSVWISPDYSANIVNPPGALFLNRLNPNVFTPWSRIMVVRRFGPNGYVRWHCGLTPERSRCPQGTRAVQGRLGPNRLLQIRCRG